MCDRSEGQGEHSVKTDPGQPVAAPSEVMARLVAEFENGSEPDLEAFAARLGVQPPDSREGWSIVYRWGPDGEDLGLIWVHPDDEPVQQID